jgi:hypothetical protein
MKEGLANTDIGKVTVTDLAGTSELFLIDEDRAFQLIDVGIDGFRVSSDNKVLEVALAERGNLVRSDDFADPAVGLHPLEGIQELFAVIHDANRLALLDPAESFLRDFAEHARAEGSLAHAEDDVADGCALAQVQPLQRLQFQLHTPSLQ